MTTLTIHESIQSIRQSLDQIIESTNSLSDKVLRWNPSEEEWSIMQILCHITEAVPYWLDEIEMLLVTPGKEWGRGLQQEARLAAVSKDRVDNTSLSSVLRELEAVKTRVEETLRKLDEEKLALEAPSRNPRFGTKPISFIVEHFLVEHTSKHLGQIQRYLSKINQ